MTTPNTATAPSEAATPNTAPTSGPVPVQLFAGAEAPCFRITAGDTVRLAVVRAPDALDPSSVSFEIWDPGGAQPLNSHPDSIETFWFLRGSGVAISDGVEHPVTAGQFLVLPPGSVHRIVNTGPGRLYAITTMSPDHGFAALITAGVPDRLDAGDVAVLTGGATRVEGPA